MQKSIAPFPPQRLRRPVIFWNHPLPFLNISYRITVWQDYRIEGKIALPMTSFKPSWAISLSLFFVLKKILYQMCKMQKRCDKMAKFGLQLAPVGLK